MKKPILLVPAFAGTFFLGALFGQEVQTFCDECQSTYISAEEIQAHIGEIRDTEGYIIPGSIADEMGLVAKAFKG